MKTLKKQTGKKHTKLIKCKFLNNLGIIIRGGVTKKMRVLYSG